MDNCNINLGAVKAKEIDGELYISCWNFSKALSEKEREISDLCEENDELKKQISELESELSIKEDLLKTAMKFSQIPEESVSLADLFKDCEEEPLPFSCDEYEEDFLEKLRSRDLNFNLVSKMLDVIELMLTDTQS